MGFVIGSIGNKICMDYSACTNSVKIVLQIILNITSLMA